MAQWRSSRRDNEEGVLFSPALFIFLVLVSCILVASDRPENRPQVLSGVRAGFNDGAMPLLELAAWPLRGIQNVGPWWRRQFELAQENRALREDLAELRAWRDVALSLRDRARLYEEALNLETPAVHDRITAWAVAERAGPFVRSRLIGVGAEDGVREGYPVVNVYGLVGRTVDVGQRSSRALLLTDLNSRVAVMADRSNARAMLTGDNTDFPRLEYLGTDPDIEEGDRIVTSGDDNVLPRGLPVGDAVRDRDGRWRVALYSDAAPLDLVWIWPFEPVAPPEADPLSIEALPGLNAEALTGDGTPDAGTPENEEAASVPEGPTPETPGPEGPAPEGGAPAAIAQTGPAEGADDGEPGGED